MLSQVTTSRIRMEKNKVHLYKEAKQRVHMLYYVLCAASADAFTDVRACTFPLRVPYSARLCFIVNRKSVLSFSVHMY